VGDRLVFKKGELEAEVEAYGPQGGGERLLRFHWTGDWWECLEKHGHTPLPPYILKARKHLEADRAAAELPEEPGDRERYQTVYAGSDRGSVAAPTAGLHFSDELLERLEQRGIRRVFLNLRVGAGTFQPVKTEDVESHPMHEEYFEIPEETARAVNQAKSEGRRIVAVGTTVVRALETAALPMRGEGGGPGLTDVFRGEKPEFAAADGVARALSGWTRLLIAPGFPFRLVDALVTNFHLPRSTLLLLVSALADREKILSAYENAVENEYRFYSYGDCSLIED
jgi:S-adenosylmethionine:tRNA ribosyltransferase-isomerase